MRIAPSLHRLVEDMVGCYLVEEAGEVTLVDAGVPGYYSDLAGELAAMGRTIEDVRAVVLTHGHSDHVGFAERIRDERGVPVSVRAKPLLEVSTFGGGTTLGVPGALRVIRTPGHTPGNTALHAPALDALFVGDTLATLAVTTGREGPHVSPFSADPEEALASLARIEDVEAAWLLPGHGAPWPGGAAAAVQAARAVGIEHLPCARGTA